VVIELLCIWGKGGLSLEENLWYLDNVIAMPPGGGAGVSYGDLKKKR
jgi:hypothetical protein